MAKQASPSPPASDGGFGARPAWDRSSASRFVWVASSPSPAEVAELERHFPDVIQVPSEVLEVGVSVWENSAIITRSFVRWVPPDAILREFRRAGIPGEIDAVSLAHRCSIFKFSDTNGRLMALERPWVVNGQPLAIEPWSPEFFPSPDAVASAMLWIRLPNLPLEFWSEEILRSILAPAGVFVCSDTPTKLKNRGSFARVCVRVDLRRPLRPGARVRGSSAPFWQPYQYEHLEGICPRCGSLHLFGPCGPLPEAEPSSANALFGPWMAAVRQRRPAQVPVPELRRKVVGVQPSRLKVSAPDEGWSEPVKIARRGVSKPSSPVAGGVSVPARAKGESLVEQSDEGCELLAKECAGSTGTGVETESVILSFNSKTQKQKPLGKAGNQVQKTQSLTLENPFALLGSDKWAGRPPLSKDARSGPSKRARASDSGYLHLPSSNGKNGKNGKRKEKRTASGSKNVHDNFIFSAASESGRGTDSQGTKDGESIQVLDKPVQANSFGGCTHDLVVTTLKGVLNGQGQELQIRTPPSLVDKSAAGEVAVGLKDNNFMDCVQEIQGDSASSPESAPDLLMEEDTDGAPSQI